MKLLLTTLFTLLLTHNINAQIVKLHPTTSTLSTISCEYQKWDGTKKDVSFTFPHDNIFGSPSNLDTGVLYTIAKTSVLYADWGIKYKPTYEFRYVGPSIGLITYMGSDFNHEIVVTIFGIAKNSYGMPGDVTTMITFNSKGEILKDKRGNLRISVISN